MNLLFQPEPMERLRSRFSQALAPVYTMEHLKSGHPRPNEQRKHVFDFEDGTRITLSHEQLGQRLYLHATCSMDKRCQISAGNFANVCYVKLCELSGQNLITKQSSTDSLSHHFLFEPIPGQDVSVSNQPQEV